jgi:hypothetical protein
MDTARGETRERILRGIGGRLRPDRGLDKPVVARESPQEPVSPQLASRERAREPCCRPEPTWRCAAPAARPTGETGCLAAALQTGDFAMIVLRSEIGCAGNGPIA